MTLYLQQRAGPKTLCSPDPPQSSLKVKDEQTGLGSALTSYCVLAS